MTRALDIGAIRAQVRALDYVRGTPAEVAMWREGDAEARANLAIEGMDLDADEHALFDMAQSARSCDFGQVEERTLNA